MDTTSNNALQLMQQHHSQQLESSLQDVARLRTFTQDYVTLKDTLQDLPKKTRHEALIPVGKGAFMPGALVHTNELLVLLGDNWFVERTATQAREIVGRRLLHCREQLKAAEAAAELQRHWVEKNFLVDEAHENGLDIKEEISEEEYLSQRARHAHMVKQHKQEQKEKRLFQEKTQTLNKATGSCSQRKLPTKSNSATTSKPCSKALNSKSKIAKSSKVAEDKRTFEEIMNNLDRLELQELEEGSEDDASSLESLVDDLSEDSDDDSSDENDDSDEEEKEEAESYDSDDSVDLPVDLNKFKNVKIESPMPSLKGENKFTYGGGETSKSGSSLNPPLSKSGRSLLDPAARAAKFEIAGPDELPSSQSRFTASGFASKSLDICGGGDSNKHIDKAANSSGGGADVGNSQYVAQQSVDEDAAIPYSGVVGNVNKVPVARRVSWADQPVYSFMSSSSCNLSSSECNDGSGSSYFETNSKNTTTTNNETSSLSSSKSIPVKIEYTATSSVSFKTSNSDDSKKCLNQEDDRTNYKSANENKVSSSSGVTINISSPADLMKLVNITKSNATTSASNDDDQSEPETTTRKRDQDVHSKVCSAGNSPSKGPIRSILKKGSSQEAFTEKGTGWLSSTGSVPITTVYDHEPPLEPEPPLAREIRDLSKAFTNKVIARDEETASSVTSYETTAVTSSDTSAMTSEAPKKMSKFKASRAKPK